MNYAPLTTEHYLPLPPVSMNRQVTRIEDEGVLHMSHHRVLLPRLAHNLDNVKTETHLGIAHLLQVANGCP